MQDKIEDIKKRMKALEILIKETKARLPAHSVKPPVMMDLLEYEDEYDALLKKFNKLKKQVTWYGKFKDIWWKIPGISAVN